MASTLKTASHIFLSIAFITALAAYRTQERDRVWVRDSAGDREISLHDALQINLSPTTRSPTAVDLATVAALAANVYEPDDLNDTVCDPSTPGRISIPGWQRLTDRTVYPKACNEDLNGLHYEVWLNYNDGFALVAVVFRGTVPEKLVHWCSNFRDGHLPMCDPTSDQYLSIAPLVDDFLDRNYDLINGPDSRVFAIGHSLGAGLAEMAADGSYIDEVFALDGSPVTAASITAALEAWVFEDAKESPEEDRTTDEDSEVNLPLSPGCRFSGNNSSASRNKTVYSIYESGEVLTPIRALAEALGATQRPHVEFRTNLMTGNPVHQHSIKTMACDLMKARGAVPMVVKEEVP